MILRCGGSTFHGMKGTARKPVGVEEQRPKVKPSPRERVVAVADRLRQAAEAAGFDDLILNLQEARDLEQDFAVDEVDPFVSMLLSDEERDLAFALLRAEYVIARGALGKEHLFTSSPIPVGESNSSDYTNDTPPSWDGGTLQPPSMGEVLTEDHFIALFRKVPEGKRDTVFDFLKEAAGETTGRAKGEPHLEHAAKEMTAPQAPAPAAPEWPSETWDKSPERASRKRYSIVVYLRRVWKPLIDDHHVIVTRQILTEKDPEAALALKGYLRAHAMPEDLHILNDKELKKHVAERAISLQTEPR